MVKKQDIIFSLILRLKMILNFFLSLRTTIWLLLALVFLLFYGAFIMPKHPEFSSINSIPLFDWLSENPAGTTWWLYGIIILLSVLTANTIICSFESLFKKQERKNRLLVISPQVIHIGFLFILLAHFLSSLGSFKGSAVGYEGTFIRLPNNLVVGIKEINLNINPSGYISDWSVNIEYLSNDGRKIKEASLKPNAPSFYHGLGIYLKDVRSYPFKAALLEVSREPGALWALIGGVLFMFGTITLLVLKIKRET
ncbi:MAG: cytochrome C biogenesis protein ResB [Nitrospirae bacterium]|nr:cytochrome C biogenesis protein ResB [Nitrospirota bacterium]